MEAVATDQESRHERMVAKPVERTHSMVARKVSAPPSDEIPRTCRARMTRDIADDE